MIIIKNRFSGFLLGKNYAAMALWPVVFVNPALPDGPISETLINHERIHLQQQKEMLLIFFLIWYLLEYLLGLIIFRDHDTAYRNISFEREAYSNERDMEYLQKRKFWDWVNW